MIKTLLYKNCILLLLLLSQHICFGQFSDSKTIRKAIAVNPTTKVSIQNKHGDINIVSWDKDSIVMESNISAQSRSLAKLQETLTQTKVDFKQNSESVQITTISFSSALSRSVIDLKSMAGVNNELRIDYTIKIPREAQLTVLNKYGDIYLESHTGTIMMELSHGNLRAKSLKKVKYLRTNFGNVFIDEVDQLKGNLLFSEIDLGSCNTLSFTSKSTDYRIKQVENIRFSTNNDKIEIDKVALLNVEGNLSKIYVDDLTKESCINLNFGKARIKRVGEAVCTLELNANRSTFDLGFNPKCSFRVDGMSNDTPFSSNNSNAHVSAEDSGVIGYYGSDEDAKCVYIFNCQKSKIYFR